MIDLKKAKVLWNDATYVPRKMILHDAKPGVGTPRQIADRFLRDNAETLKLSGILKDLRYEKTAESLGATAVFYQQHIKNVPIHGAWVAIHLDRKKRIFLIKNDIVPQIQIEKTKQKMKAKAKEVSPAEIERIVRRKAAELGAISTTIKKERMLYWQKNELRFVYKVKFGTKKPAGSWILFLDSFDGNVLEIRDILKKATGRGQVFIPNPVVALNKDNLADMGNASAVAFKNAYRLVTLKGLDGSGRIKGQFVDTTNTPSSVKSSKNEFIYARRNRAFEAVMVYYHLDSLQRYLQSLGFTGSKAVLNRPLKVNVHGTQEDNSYYDPSPNKQDLTFGDGGVDDAEDADVIIHEYSHAIQDAIVPGFGQNHEGGAMGEGFGDYMAASFFDKYKTGTRKVKFAQWDAKGVEGGPLDCLRRLDSKKKYPTDMTGEVHDDGEIWSACLLQLRTLLGGKKADIVILESHFYLNQYADFRDGAEAIILAEKNLYGGNQGKQIQATFQKRGIPC
jgi:Zn-dependent metalloprotease